MKNSLLVVLCLFVTLPLVAQVTFITENKIQVTDYPEKIRDFVRRPNVGKAAMVNVNLKALLNQEVRIEVFGDSHDLFGTISGARTVGDFTWSGKNSAEETFVFTVRDSEISGLFYTENIMKRLITMDGNYVLYEVDQSQFKPEKCDVKPSSGDELIQNSGRGISASSLDCKVRVLFVFTQKALNLMSSSMENFAQSCVDITNSAYQNSGITARVEVAHVYKTSFVENSSDMDQSLTDFTGTADGKMDEVHNLRSKYSADLCVLIGEYGDYCGIAWLYSNYGTGFSVDHVSCAIDNLTFPHELGHNFGAYHDPFVTSGNPKAYGYGYVNVDKRWRTVMAYNNHCGWYGYFCTRIPYFSNPSVNYGGDPTGTANKHNNARVHNEEYANIVSLSQPVNNLILNPLDTVGVYGHAISRQSITNSGAFIVGSNEKFSFNTGNKIELKPGFSAVKGSRFEAGIKTVSTCGSVSDAGAFRALGSDYPMLSFSDNRPVLSSSEAVKQVGWLDAFGQVTTEERFRQFVKITSDKGEYLYAAYK